VTQKLVYIACPHCKRDMGKIDFGDVSVRVPLYHRCVIEAIVPHRPPFVIKFGPRLAEAPV
jgi:hypothetical protein